MSDDQTLRSRRALVTGAAHGIGRRFTHALAEAGAAVIAADIDMNGLRETSRTLSEGASGSIETRRLDVADEADVAEAAAGLGNIDLLVNNAAIYSSVPLNRASYDKLQLADWQRMLEVNLVGVWLLCRAFVPGMQAAGYGKVVNISSGTALKGSGGLTHYAASKAGVIGFSKTLAREVGTDGVTVNVLAPGNTLSEDDASDETFAARSRTATTRAIPRVQVPDDLVGALVFLSSPASDFMTGQTLVVDGGSYMH